MTLRKLALVLALAAATNCAGTRPPVPAARQSAAPSTTAPAPIPPSSPTSTTDAPTTSTSIEATPTPAPVPTTARSAAAAVVAGTTSASWYGDESGTHTANGSRYDPDGLTFAHRSMPFGTAVRFCRGGVCVVATCTDRGPAAWTGRDFDLSRGTFAQLAPLSVGVATVSWERLG